MQKSVIIGTAGHIDHGKSALVKQLTGTDPDRLKEEKERQLTIDLGFAFLTDHIAIIDVPGHEKFIKNMVAGASTIDLAMLIIAADDGIMPQTREHFNIMQLLGIPAGLVVITKIDLVDEEWLALVEDDVKKLVKDSFLAEAPIHKVSAKSGAGISALKADLIRKAHHFQRASESKLFRLPVDRAFTVKGFGTVVTGSVISGSATVGEQVELLPQNKITTIRHMQSHNRDVKQVKVGDRAAVNLAGIPKKNIERGNYICTPGFFETTDLLTVRVQLLPDAARLDYNSRVRVHLGTGEFLGRLRLIGRDRLDAGQAGVAQLKLAQKISGGFRDPFILRTYSPMHTIGGGRILEIKPQIVKQKDKAYARQLTRLKAADLKDCIRWLLESAASPLIAEREFARKFSVDLKRVSNALRDLQHAKIITRINESYILTKRLQVLKQRVLEKLQAFHSRHPLKLGIRSTELFNQLDASAALRDYLVTSLEQAGAICLSDGRIAHKNFKIRLSAAQSKVIERLEKQVKQAGFSPPSTDQLRSKLSLSASDLEQYLELLQAEDKIVILDQGLVFHQQTVQAGARKT